MYIYRALNKYDEKIDPIKNGLFSKKLIDSALEEKYLFIVNSLIKKEGYSKNNFPQFNNLNNKNKLKIIPNIIDEIIEESDKIQNNINVIIKNYLNCHNIESLSGLADILASKNSHLLKGTKLKCDWISFSKSLYIAKKYCEQQDDFSIAVIDSNINKFIEIFQNNTLIGLDLSSDENILNNEFIINKNMTHTDLLYKELKNTKCDSDVVYYNKIPKEKIITVLNTLEYELLVNDIFDENYFSFSDIKRKIIIRYILNSVFEELKDKGDILNYIIKNYYKNNIPLEKLVNNHYNKDILNEANSLIINEINKNKVKIKNFL